MIFYFVCMVLISILLLVFFVLNIKWIKNNKNRTFLKEEKKKLAIRHGIIAAILVFFFIVLIGLLPQIISDMSASNKAILHAKDMLSDPAVDPDMIAGYKKSLKTERNMFTLYIVSLLWFVFILINAIQNLILTMIYLKAKTPNSED